MTAPLPLNTQQAEAAIRALPTESDTVHQLSTDLRLARQAVLEAEKAVQDARGAHRRDRALKEKEVMDLWRAWLALKYAPDLPTDVQQEIYSSAWDQGHSSGLNEVENFYQDIAAFAKRAYDAGAMAAIPED